MAFKINNKTPSASNGHRESFSGSLGTAKSSHEDRIAGMKAAHAQRMAGAKAELEAIKAKSAANVVEHDKAIAAIHSSAATALAPLKAKVDALSAKVASTNAATKAIDQKLGREDRARDSTRGGGGGSGGGGEQNRDDQGRFA